MIDSVLKVKTALVEIFEVCGNNQNKAEVKGYFERLAEVEDSQIKNISRRLVELEQGY